MLSKEKIEEIKNKDYNCCSSCTIKGMAEDIKTLLAEVERMNNLHSDCLCLDEEQSKAFIAALEKPNPAAVETMKRAREMGERIKEDNGCPTCGLVDWSKPVKIKIDLNEPTKEEIEEKKRMAGVRGSGWRY